MRQAAGEVAEIIGADDGRGEGAQIGAEIVEVAPRPLVFKLAATLEPRVRATIEAIQRDLTEGGFVLRYRTHPDLDGLPAGEGVFLACSFWLADCLIMLGRREEARDLFERLCRLANDVGLLAEEYDPRSGRQLGNFPQAFSHVALVNTAMNLSAEVKPVEQRADKKAA